MKWTLKALLKGKRSIESLKVNYLNYDNFDMKLIAVKHLDHL